MTFNQLFEKSKELKKENATRDLLICSGTGQPIDMTLPQYYVSFDHWRSDFSEFESFLNMENLMMQSDYYHGDSERGYTLPRRFRCLDQRPYDCSEDSFLITPQGVAAVSAAAQFFLSRPDHVPSRLGHCFSCNIREIEKIEHRAACSFKNHATHLAQMEELSYESEDSEDIFDEFAPQDIPFSSENHKSQLVLGEILVGGMPQKKKKKNNRRKAGKSPNQGAATNRIRTMGTIPVSAEVDFIHDRVFTLSGSPNAEDNYRVNDLYNPTSLGTPVLNLIPGTELWGRTYSVSRFIKGVANYTVTNESDNSVEILAGVSNTAIGSPTTALAYVLSNPRTKSRVLALTGGMNLASLSLRYTAQQIAQDPAVHSSGEYAQTFLTASPSNLLWSFIMARTLSGANVGYVQVRQRTTNTFLLSHVRVDALAT